MVSMNSGLPIAVRILGGSANGCDLDSGTGNLDGKPSVVAGYVEVLRGEGSPLPAHLRNLTCEVFYQLDSQLLRLQHFLPVAEFLHAEERKQQHRGIVFVQGLGAIPTMAKLITVCFPFFRSPIVLCATNGAVNDPNSDGPSAFADAIRCAYDQSVRHSMKLKLYLRIPSGLALFEPEVSPSSVPSHQELGFEDMPGYSFKPA